MCSLAALARGCRPAAKPCCLCWCCCCSCSWAKCLAARGSDAEPGKKPREAGPHDPLLCDGDQAPSLEEIRSWGQSFDRLMRSAAGRKVFRDFLRGEYSEENIMFWLACEELKRETDPDAIEEKARFIYEDYISILSPKEVSLDSRVREVVNRNMVEPTPHTFDEAQLQIYTLMHRDSYPRFVASPLYKTLAKLTNGSPSGAPDKPPEPSPTEVTSPDSKDLNTELKESKPEIKESRTDFKESRTESKESRTDFKESKTESKESKTEIIDSKTELKESKKDMKDSSSPTQPLAPAPAPTSDSKQ